MQPSRRLGLVKREGGKLDKQLGVDTTGETIHLLTLTLLGGLIPRPTQGQYKYKCVVHRDNVTLPRLKSRGQTLIHRTGWANSPLKTGRRAPDAKSQDQPTSARASSKTDSILQSRRRDRTTDKEKHPSARKLEGRHREIDLRGVLLAAASW
jgi:hypothetical protein